jgi:hypothetical protein
MATSPASTTAATSSSWLPPFLGGGEICGAGGGSRRPAVGPSYEILFFYFVKKLFAVEQSIQTAGWNFF